MIKNKKIFAFLLTLVIVAVFAIPYVAFENVNAETNDSPYVSVRDFGAKGNGLVDETDAINAAIAKVKENGGGIVYFPAGVYKITKGNISVPSGVSILGTLGATTGPWQNFLDAQGKGGASAGFIPGNPSTYTKVSDLRGSWIVAAHGEGKADSPATFYLDGNTSFSRIGFVSMFSTPLATKTIPSPAHIAIDTSKMANTKDPINISDVSIPNCYAGITVTQGDGITDFDLGTEKALKSIGKVTIENIMGSPMNKGIIVKGIASEVVLRNLQFNYAVYLSAYDAERTLYSNDIVLAACSNVTIDRVLSFGADVGIKTEKAYNNLGVNLKASGLNLENRIPVYLTAAGNYDIKSSYFFLTNYASARDITRDSEYRPIYIVDDEQSSVTSSYKFRNIFLQDAGVDKGASDNTLYNDSFIDITAKNKTTLLFENIETYGEDISAIPDPIISYTHIGSGESNCTVRNSVFLAFAPLQPLVEVNGNGKFTMEYCRFPAHLQYPSNIVLKNCTEISGSASTLVNFNNN